MFMNQDVSAAAVNALKAALSTDFPEAKISNVGTDMLRVSLGVKGGRSESSDPNHDRFAKALARSRHWHVLWPSFLIKVSMIVTDHKSQEVLSSFQETIESRRLAA